MQFIYSAWLNLSVGTRHLIAKEFGITKTSATHVQDNVVVADGYKIHDVESALNPEALQKYLESDEEAYSTLWSRMIDKIEGREHKAVIVDVIPDPETKVTVNLPTTVPPIVPKRRGRPKIIK